MYLFEITYYNRDGLEDKTEALRIDTAGIEITEKEVYLMAMGKAYEKSVEMGAEWGLGSIEFIAS